MRNSSFGALVLILFAIAVAFFCWRLTDPSVRCGLSR